MNQFTNRVLAVVQQGMIEDKSFEEMFPVLPPKNKIPEKNTFDVWMGQQDQGNLKAAFEKAAPINPPQTGRLNTVEAALKFILAGNAVFTLVSAKTGVRYTYKVSLVDGQEPNPRWGKKYFVALLTGPENTSDYTYMGMLEGHAFRLTKASRLARSSKPVVAFEWAMLNLQGHKKLPASLEIWHTGHCGRCNRLLTVPSSVELGLGPECAGRL